MDLVEGTYVRHAAKPEWGLGLIEAVKEQDLHVRFENQPGTKVLRRDRVASKLEVVPEEDVPDGHPLRRPAPRGHTAATGGRVRCSACGERLKTSRFSADERWKSCPRCSGAQGAEHVYRRYPDDFGTSAARQNESNPDGWQSHCAECRTKTPPELTGPHVRLCSEVR